MKILNFAELVPGTLKANDYVVFGGTFDPIHEGHISVIRRLLPVFRQVVIAPTEANPWKAEAPTSLKLRQRMIAQVLTAEGLPPVENQEDHGVSVEAFPYSYSEELVDHLRATRTGTLFWAVGADSADSVKDWRNWQSKEVMTVVLPIEIDAHAVLVRQGKALAHPAIRDFIREHGLYENV